MVSDEITNDIDGSTVKLHYSAKIPYTYHHDAIYNMTGVEVVDNTLRIENAIPRTRIFHDGTTCQCIGIWCTSRPR